MKKEWIADEIIQMIKRRQQTILGYDTEYRTLQKAIIKQMQESKKEMSQ